MRNSIIDTQRLLVGLLTCTTAASIVIAPDAAAQTPYPNISSYTSSGSLEKFKVVNGDGVWFTTPVGLHCGIGDDARYGCSGSLPGAPSDTNEIGWFPGDSFPRLYRTDEPKFASGRGQTVLGGGTILAYRGSKCALTYDAAVYCINGDNPDSQIMVTPSKTYRGREAAPAI